MGETDIPVILWNEEYAFLVHVPAAPQGWQVVEIDSFDGAPYYRRAAEDEQNFAVETAGTWAASLAAKWQMDSFLIGQFQEMFPPIVEQIFPYRLLIQASEVHITGVLHENFHAFVALNSPERLEEAEEGYQYEERYWQADENMEAVWKTELQALAKALEADTEAERREYTRQFLDIREERRSAAGLPENLVAFERLLEWEEGLAKYAELLAWKLAWESDSYQPSAALGTDPYFKAYQTFEGRWRQELTTLKNQHNQQSVTRFYYSGMAQAFLLDELLPGWKEQALGEGVWLEDLLAEAVRE